MTATTIELFTAQQVGEALGLTAGRVRRVAQRLGVGRQFGRDWAFSAADLEAIRTGRRAYAKRPVPETGPATA